ncbi:MAG: hypothetical protein ABT15_05460 [Pseudonocardia sp. SCN 73-27]|nr:MAG: hypothetical protein ABS80_00940 [Pseudonocardia sp. SCN 72-51]ODV08128.1 MAG: hypothetical protein ABT15_05460 [Pseudonocardia sp. SCN 73-27]
MLLQELLDRRRGSWVQPLVDLDEESAQRPTCFALSLRTPANRLLQVVPLLGDRITADEHPNLERTTLQPDAPSTRP